MALHNTAWIRVYTNVRSQLKTKKKRHAEFHQAAKNHSITRYIINAVQILRQSWLRKLDDIHD